MMTGNGAAEVGRLAAFAANTPGALLPHENLTYDDVLRIVELIRAAEQFSEFRLKVGEIEIELRRRGAPPPEVTAARGTAAGHRAGTDPAPAPSSVPPVALRAADPPQDQPQWPLGSTVIRSPMVGTFYRAPGPGVPPFVDVGQPVNAESVVCIIEVMKLMNSIAAGTRGVVTHILVDDGALVEAGQPLVVVQPQDAG